MQDPVNEIESVIKGLIEPATADDQASTLRKYFTADASFDHPLCSVAGSPGSRDGVLLPIYQWLKIMFVSKPDTFRVKSVAYDAEHQQLFVEGAQHLVPRIPLLATFLSPWAPIFVVLYLSYIDGKYYVKKQQDLYQVQVIPGAISPHLFQPLILILKAIAGYWCILFALLGQYVFGVWKTTPIPAKWKLERVLR